MRVPTGAEIVKAGFVIGPAIAAALIGSTGWVDQQRSQLLVLAAGVWFVAALLWTAFESRLQPVAEPEKPVLEVTPILGRETLKGVLTGRPTGQSADFIWLNVKNRAKKSAGDAINVWAILTFARFEMSPARWRDSEDPSRVPNAGSISDRRDIQSGHTHQLDVAFRFDGETEGHGLNTEAMQPQYKWLRPGWELAVGDHEVRIDLDADNAPAASYRLAFKVPPTGPFEITAFEKLGDEAAAAALANKRPIRKRILRVLSASVALAVVAAIGAFVLQAVFWPQSRQLQISNRLLLPIAIAVDGEIVATVQPGATQTMELPIQQHFVEWTLDAPAGPDANPVGSVLGSRITDNGEAIVLITNLVDGVRYFVPVISNYKGTACSLVIDQPSADPWTYPREFGPRELNVVTAYLPLTDTTVLSASCPGKAELRIGDTGPLTVLLEAESGALRMPIYGEYQDVPTASP